MRKFAFVLLLVSPMVFAVGEKTFTFTPPTAYVDGTPLPQSKIAAYDIQCNGTLLATVPNTPLNTDTYVAQPGTFPTGNYACVAFTVTTEGVRSGPSNTVNFTVVPGVPAAPVNFAVE
jgi:hypothetical protein